ncbi:hypothetical protein ABBQ38_013880 [Trebouxia sp. C0009 RCD-2024]
MAKAEQQALRLFNNKQDTDLAVFLQAQPVAAGAAHLSLKTLADAGMAKSYTALLQSDLATQHNEPSDDSPALALHQLVGSMTEKGMPFITEVIAAMHAAGLSLDSTNADKDTPLHLAARSGQLQLCQLLVQHGADALARNTKNRTPGGQAKLAAEVKSFLAEIETLAKDRRQIQKNSLWDDKMKATQTQSAYGVQCL